MRLVWVVLLMLTCSFLQAQRLKFVGTHLDERNDLEFRLTFTATKVPNKPTYTVIGTISATDGNYAVTGTYYGNTGKLRANVRRANPIKGKPAFDQPLSGETQPGGNAIKASCLLLSPKTKASFTASFVAYKVADSSESEATLRVFKYTGTAGETPAELKVDGMKGLISVRLRDARQELRDYTISFTPLPQAFAFGGQWTFNLDASTIPADVRCPLKITLQYLDNTPGSPYIEMDLSNGTRRFSRAMTWNCPGPEGYQGISFLWNQSSGPFYKYQVTTMKRADFDRATGPYNQAVGAGGTGTQGSGTSTTSGTGTRTGSGSGSGSGGSQGSGSTSRPGPTSLRVGDVKGDVEVRTSVEKDSVPLRPGMVLTRGAIIETDPDSSATLQLPSGAMITLSPGTSIKVEELTPTGNYAAVQVRILFGEIEFRSLSSQRTVRSDFVVRANECVTSTRGTVFKQSYDPKTQLIKVDLRSGSLEFDPGHGLEKMLLDAPTTITWRASRPSRR